MPPRSPRARTTSPSARPASPSSSTTPAAAAAAASSPRSVYAGRAARPPTAVAARCSPPSPCPAPSRPASSPPSRIGGPGNEHGLARRWDNASRGLFACPFRPSAARRRLRTGSGFRLDKPRFHFIPGGMPSTSPLPPRHPAARVRQPGLRRRAVSCAVHPVPPCAGGCAQLSPASAQGKRAPCLPAPG